MDYAASFEGVTNMDEITPLAIFLFVGSAFIVALGIYMRKNKA